MVHTTFVAMEGQKSCLIHLFAFGSQRRITRYGKEGFEIHGRPEGTVMTVECSWLKDKFGLSWQVVPRALSELVGSPDAEKSQHAMKAMLQMKKIDLEAIRQAYGGTA